MNIPFVYNRKVQPMSTYIEEYYMDNYVSSGKYH